MVQIDNDEYMTNIINPCVYQKNIETIYIETNSDQNRIILNPEYQRNVVWSVDNMRNFIDSIMIGIVPNQLIFNREQSGDKICIDGKQRITSIIKFKNNKFPLFIDGLKVYYDDNKNKKLSRCFTNNEKNIFNCRHINITEYHNLTYEQQVNIFNRLQNGIILTFGEVTLSHFTNQDLCHHVRTSLDKCKNLHKFYDGSRREDLDFLLKFMYTIEIKLLLPPKKIYMNIIDKIENMKNAKNIITNCCEFVDLCLSKKLLGSLKKLPVQNILFPLMHLLYEDYNITIFSDDNLEEIKKQIIALLNKMSSEKMPFVKNSKSETNLKKIRKYISTNITIEFSDSDDSDSCDDTITEFINKYLDKYRNKKVKKIYDKFIDFYESEYIGDIPTFNNFNNRIVEHINLN